MGARARPCRASARRCASIRRSIARPRRLARDRGARRPSVAATLRLQGHRRRPCKQRHRQASTEWRPSPREGYDSPPSIGSRITESGEEGVLIAFEIACAAVPLASCTAELRRGPSTGRYTLARLRACALARFSAGARQPPGRRLCARRRQPCAVDRIAPSSAGRRARCGKVAQYQMWKVPLTWSSAST